MVLPMIIVAGIYFALHLCAELFFEPLPAIAQAASRAAMTIMVVGAIGLAFAPGAGTALMVAVGGLVWSSVVMIVVIRLLIGRAADPGEKS